MEPSHLKQRLVLLSAVVLSAAIFSAPLASASTGGIGAAENASAPTPAEQPAQPGPQAEPGAGGMAPGAPTSTPLKFKIVDGLAVPQVALPAAIQGIVDRGNVVAKYPYRFGGGHKDFDLGEISGLDCSGSVTKAVGPDIARNATFDSRSIVSADWVEPGPGQVATFYTNPGHMFMVLGSSAVGKGIRFDTGARREGSKMRRGSGKGSRWSLKMRPTSGYTAYHPKGL